ASARPFERNGRSDQESRFDQDQHLAYRLEYRVLRPSTGDHVRRPLQVRSHSTGPVVTMTAVKETTRESARERRGRAAVERGGSREIVGTWSRDVGPVAMLWLAPVTGANGS